MTGVGEAAGRGDLVCGGGLRSRLLRPYRGLWGGGWVATRLGAVAMLLGFCAPLAMAQTPPSEAFRYERPLPVATPGWVRVGLDVATRGAMRPDGRDLRVLDPAGDVVAYWLVPAEPMAGGTALISGPLTVARVAEGSGSVTYRLDLPGRGLAPAGLRLSWRGADAVGYRVQRPVEGDWRTSGEGELRGGGGRIPLLATSSGASPAPATDALRLELWSEAEGLPEVTAAKVEIPATWAVFQADEAGAYRLAYGAREAPAPAPPGQLPVSLPEATIVVPGVVQTNPPPPLPASALAPGATLNADEFAANWPVLADGAAAGDLARLVVPDAVYGVAERQLADVRLETDGRRLPHVQRPLEAPVAVIAAAGLKPRVRPEGGPSYLLLHLPVAGLPITAIDLAAPAAPFARRVTAGYLLDGEGPDLPRYYQQATIEGKMWSCSDTSRQPCRLRLGGKTARSRWLLLTFDDGENAPLPAVDVTVWRQGHELRFPWPGGAVRLLAGNPELGRPQYDLAAVADQLDDYPMHEARLVEATAEPALGVALARLDEDTTWLTLVVALILAGAVLLALLARVLRTPEET